jgi:hypothetical protein
MEQKVAERRRDSREEAWGRVCALMKAVYTDDFSKEEPLPVLWPALRSIALGVWRG